ncbi:hypothetical protein K439DRAFT_1664124 [Ramaria rubella]|nr:hypothetical protein K439DRAFT_1664124 [Ramaria rubella]
MSKQIFRRVLLASSVRAPPAICLHIRHIHPSAVSLKKKRTSLSEQDQFVHNEDSAFPESFEEDELFGSPLQPSGSVHHVDQGNVHQRSELFKALHASSLDILQQRGKMRQPPRRTTVLRLAALSDTKEDLERVVEVIGAWRNAPLPHSASTSEQFIGRCARLGHLDVALKVLQDRPKYGLDIPSLPCARRFLQALSRQPTPEHDPTRVLTDCLALAELYPLYGFPPASNDVVSCTILASVISRHIYKNKKTELQESVEVSESWRAVVAELESAVKGWEGVVEERSPRVLQWMRGNIRDIRVTMQRVEGRTAGWLWRFRRDIRPDESGPVVAHTNW